MLRLDFQQLLYSLFCVYTFLLPFEFILEVWFGIDTVFKPYRVTSLLIIGVFVLSTVGHGVTLRKDIKEDLFLYAVFFYGILISLFRIITGRFNMNYFTNDLFQSGLYLSAFFIFKTLDLSKEQIQRLFHFFVMGLFLNAVYIFYNFFFLASVSRDAGFMDNPNYVALGLVAVISYFLLKLDFVASSKIKLVYTILLLFLLYIFIITGSRTGLILLILSVFLIFFFLSLRRKIILLATVAGLLLLLIPRQMETLELGGPLILVNRVANSLYSNEEDVRFVIWRGTLRALEEEGYVGMGIGQFKAHFPFFFRMETDKLITEIVNRGYHLSTHNDYLAIVTDYGIPGLVLYLLFLFFSFKRVFHEMLYRGGREDTRLLVVFNFSILTCLIVFGLAAENFQNQLFWFLLMLSTKSVD